MAAPDSQVDVGGGESAGAGRDEGRRSRRRRELHEKIFDTARGLFLQQGFDATRVEDIAAAADIAPATFFNHFPNKEAVLREMAGEVFARFHSLVREQIGSDLSTRERLIGFADTAARLVERGPELTRRVLLEVHKAVGPGQAGAELAGLEAEMVALVRAGIERGDVRDDMEESLLAELAVSAIIGVMTRWIHDGAYPLRQRMRQAATFLAEAFDRDRRNDGGRDNDDNRDTDGAHNSDGNNVGARNDDGNNARNREGDLVTAGRGRAKNRAFKT